MAIACSVQGSIVFVAGPYVRVRVVVVVVVEEMVRLGRARVPIEVRTGAEVGVRVFVESWCPDRFGPPARTSND